MKFPHFTRFFSARLSALTAVLLWFGLWMLILVNLYAKFVLITPHQSVVDQVLLSPYQLDEHLNLARWFWQNGYRPMARGEIATAQWLFESLTKNQIQQQNQKILGARSTPLDLLHEWENEPQQLKAQYDFWYKVVSAKPDWPGAYVYLAVSAYRLAKVKEAKTALEKALQLDPNYALAIHLFKELKL